MYLFEQWKAYLATCLLAVLSGFELMSQDTIPPFFVRNPAPDSVTCTTVDAAAKLGTWYQNHSGAQMSDNSGNVSIQATLSMNRAVSLFDSLKVLTCSRNRQISVGFYGTDGSGNISDTLYAVFKIENAGPIIVRQADFNTQKSCGIGIQDSLIAWIKKSGNAVVADGCGGKSVWQNFIFTTNLGAQGSGDIAKGPYPSIPSNACNWAMDISFFVSDSCGNNRAVTGRFRIRDDVPPKLVKPDDLTVSCDMIPDTSIVVTDYCDQSPFISFSQTSSQSTDLSSCEHYNYLINRKWIAIDKCGNRDSVQQRIWVNDINPPLISAPADLTVQCDSEDASQPTQLEISDACSDYVFTFRDSLVSGNPCLSQVIRMMEASDVCGNIASFRQNLLIVDTKSPAVVTRPSGLVLVNPDSLSLKNNIDAWLSSVAGVEATDNCQTVISFMKISGTYDTLKRSDMPPISTSFADIPKCHGEDTLIYVLFDVIVRDSCGNVFLDTASLLVLDTLAPVFDHCTSDTLFFLGQCPQPFIIPSFTEATSDSISYTLDGFGQVLAGDTISLAVSNGQAGITLRAMDCAGNESICQTPVVVLDTLDPKYSYGTCGGDTIYLNAGLKSYVSFLDSLDILWLKDGDTIGFGNQFIYTSSAPEGNYTLRINYQTCSMNQAFVVQNKDTFQPELSVSNQEFCYGSSLVLETGEAGNAAKYVWTRLGEEISMDTTSQPTLQIDLLDSTQYYVQILENGCLSSRSDTLDIKPVIVEKSVSDAIFLCENASAAVEVSMPNANYLYQWILPNGDTLVGANITLSDSIFSEDLDSLKLTAFSGSCASESLYVPVSVTRFDSVSILGTSLLCTGSSLLLQTGITADSTQWYRNQTYLLSSDQLAIDSVAPSHSGTYSAKLFLHGCETESSPFEVKIEGSLRIQIVSDRPANCEGDSMRLSVAAIEGATYVWKGPDGLSGDQPSISFIGKSGLFSVEVSQTGNCTGKKDTMINVLVRPRLIRLESDFDPCSDVAQDSVRFKAHILPDTGRFSYNWFGPGNFRSTLKEPAIFNSGDGILGRYRLEVRNGQCISSIEELYLSGKVNQGKANLEMGAFYCEGDIVRLTSRDSFVSYEWHLPDTTILTSGRELILSEPIQTGPYYLVGKSGSCLSLASDTIQLQQVNRPTAPEILMPDSICFGDSLHLKLLQVLENQTYEWALPTGASFSSSGNLAYIDIPDKLMGNYSVRAVKGYCKSEISNSVRVNIKAPIESPTFRLDQLNICDTGDVPVDFCLATTPTEPGLLYSISTYPDNTILLEGRDSCFSFRTKDMPRQFSRIRIRSKRNECYSDVFDDILVHKAIQPEVVADINADLGLQICDFSDTLRVFNANRPDSIQYFWRILEPEVVLVNEENNVLKLFNFKSDTTHVLLSLNYDICRDFSRDTALIITASKDSVGYDSLRLEGESKDVEIVDYTPDFIDLTRFDISFKSGSGYEVTPQSGDNFQLTLDKNNLEFRIPIEVCSKRCISYCQDTYLAISREASETACKIPNAITPNGDGVNDVLVIDCLSDMDDYRLSIFNQWGDLVFETTDYQNNWDGTYKGEMLPEGTYYYLLDDRANKFSGFIMIKR